MSDLALAFTGPVHALPVDVFRVLAGLVGFAYFARVFHDTRDFSSRHGLIDHELCRRLFPPTRLSLFHPRIPDWLFRPVFALACLAALSVAAGWFVKPAAALLFVISVSTYRWNLLAVYVDDAIMHLTFFWILLLPVGTTLTLPGWAGGGTEVFELWSTATAPGAAVRAFLANMALVYLVAGLYKLTSPMWRNGTALHAILKMPIARAPERVRLRHHRLLRLANYWALVMEPVFALIFVAPDHSGIKWLLVLNAAVFHVGIILCLKIPFANLAMLGALPVAMGPEIMAHGFGRPALAPGTSFMLSPPEVIAVCLVGTLTAMVLWEALRSWRLNDVSLWKTHVSGFLGNPMYVVLWLIGIAQSYRLFDWVDSRNYHVRYEVRVATDSRDEARPVDPADLFPRSLRHLLLQSYLLGNVWLQVAPAQREVLRRSLLERHARRFARLNPDAREVVVFAESQRITSDNLDLARGQRRLLMRFHCRAGSVHAATTTKGAEEACVVS